jgi:hypothetical protein
MAGRRTRGNSRDRLLRWVQLHMRLLERQSFLVARE